MQRSGAQPAAYALEVLLIERIGLHLIPVDVEHDLQRPPASNGCERGLAGNIGIPLHGLDGRTVEGFVDAPPLNGHAAFGVVLFKKGRHGSQLVRLAAPAKIFGRGAEALHLLKKAALSFDLLQPQLVGVAQLPHIFHSLGKFQTGVDEENLWPGEYLLGKAKAGQAVFSPLKETFTGSRFLDR